MDQDEFVSHMEVALMAIKSGTALQRLSSLFCSSAALFSFSLHSQIALIPKGQELTIMPQWQGYKALMERSPEVVRVDAEIVMDGEEYRLDAETGKFVHSFDPFEGRDFSSDLAGLKGGYLRIIFSNPDMNDKYHFVTKETISKARSCSRGRVWSQWPKAMVWKTLYKDGFARACRSS